VSQVVYGHAAVPRDAWQGEACGLAELADGDYVSLVGGKVGVTGICDVEKVETGRSGN